MEKNPTSANKTNQVKTGTKLTQIIVRKINLENKQPKETFTFNSLKI